MPSNNKKTIQKTHRNKYISVRFISHIIGMLIILMLSFFVFRHSQIINDLAAVYHDQYMFDISNNRNRSFQVDIVNNAAYLPDLKLKYKYDNQAMQSLLYRSYNDLDSEPNNWVAVIVDSDNYIYDKYDAESKQCRQPFEVTVNYIEEEGYNIVFDKRLSDGRQYRLYQNSDQVCQGYLTGETGRIIIESLKLVESY